jgi:hypothetical protein
LHRKTWYTGTCGNNGHGLTIRVSFMVNVCVCGGFGSNDSWPMMQSFPMDDHYRTDVISDVGHSGLNSIVSLVLRTVCFVQLLGHWHCTTSPSGQRYIYIYHLHDNCHLIMLHVFYNKRIHKLMTGMSCGFLLTKSLDLPLYYFPFFSICMIMLF